MNNKKMLFTLGGLLLVVVLALVVLANSPYLDSLTGGGDTILSGLRVPLRSRDSWEVKIQQAIGRDQLKNFGGVDRLTATLTKQIGESLSGEFTDQVEFSVSANEKLETNKDLQFINADGGVVVTTVLRGQDPAIIGPVMFDDLYGLYNLLAGPIKLTMTGEVSVGTPLHLNLLTNSSTGYGWYGMEKSELVTKKGEKFGAKWEISPGTPEIQSMDFIFNTSGNVDFVLDYTRPWERTESWQFTDINISQRNFTDIFDLFPLDPRFGGPDPYAVAEYEAEHKWDSGGLPKTYSWITSDNRKGRALDLVVGNQLGCGSCWTFSSTGLTEAVLQVQNGTGSYNLSEQYLLSCNQQGYDCDGGWPWDTLEYHIDKGGLSNNQPGAVLETDMPYNPWGNNGCPTIQNHNVKLASRHWVVDDPNNGDDLAYVEDIKLAMREYGPIEVLVCASGAFQWYFGGVFTADNCDDLNHAVLLVGWDNNTESWILKNSWGTNWGENGYMRIKWGVNRVGVRPIYAIAP